MRRVPRFAQLFTVLAVAHVSAAVGQDVSRPAPGADPVSVATLGVRFVAEPVGRDGRLDEAFWMQADSIFDLRQREPFEGRAATERTVVRVVRDAETLYIGVWAYESSPTGVTARQLRRDADLSSDDNVTILIDGHHDRRSAFLFGTNPNGAMWDAQFIGVDNLNENWNGIWEVATHRTSAGWTAAFRIPFRTLRFRAGADSVGFNVRRFIRRKNEEDLWRSYGRAEGLYQLLREGAVTGLGDVARALSVGLRPYVLGRAVEPEYDTLAVKQANGLTDGKVGLDAKVAVTPTLTGDVTLNTDFAQVEADQQVINLSRFPLFFPEKREFFLESSGIFSFGFNEISQLFYSRRIGLTQDSAGNASGVPILAGGRVYGKAGPWTIGLLDARTGGADQANDAVVRVKHDIFSRSYLGAMATMRSGPGAHGVEQTFGFDADFPLVVNGHNVEPTFYISGTRTPGTPGTPVAFRVATDYPNDLFNNFASLYHIESGYAPALGFIRRTGIWETTGHVDFQPRPHLLGIRQLDIKFPIPEWDIIVPEGGSLARTADWQTAWFEWRPLGGEFQSGDRFEVNYQRQLDAPSDTFEVFRGVNVAPGRYWWNRWELQYETSQARALSAWAMVRWGGFYGGRATTLALQGAWRPGGHLILGLDLTRTEARIPAGHFAALQGDGRLEYNFNTRTAFLGFVQWNNADQRVDFNLRFHWIPKIGDDWYVVWNSGYPTNSGALYRFLDRRAWGRPLNGAFVVKIAHRLAP